MTPAERRRQEHADQVAAILRLRAEVEKRKAQGWGPYANVPMLFKDAERLLAWIDRHEPAELTERDREDAAGDAEFEARRNK